MPDCLIVNLMQATNTCLPLHCLYRCLFHWIPFCLQKIFAGEPATGYGALPLSYARHLRTATTAGFEPATSRLTVEVTHVFTTGKSIARIALTCCHQVQAVLFLLQRQKETLKLSHGFCRSRSFNKLLCFHLRRVWEKSAIQFCLLAIARSSKEKLVIDPARTQQRLVQLLDMIRRHYKQNACGRMKTVQHIQ